MRFECRRNIYPEDDKFRACLPLRQVIPSNLAIPLIGPETFRLPKRPLYSLQTGQQESPRIFTMSTPFDFSIAGNYFTEVYLMFDDPWYYHVTTNDTVSRTIEVNKPYVDLGSDISTVRPDTVVLKAYSGVPGQTYSWQDASTDSLFHVSTDGTYYVTVSNGIGCTASDTIQVLQLVVDVGVTAYLGAKFGL